MITKEYAQSIAANRIDKRFRFRLYNGEMIYCIPIIYYYNEDCLEVAILPANSQNGPLVKLKRELIETATAFNQENYYSQGNLSGNSYSGEYARKLIIIGAGASYGYSNRLDETRKSYAPPLANEIFSEKFNQYLDVFPGAFNFAAYSELHTDVEAFFQAEWDRISSLDVYDPATVYALINLQYYLAAVFYKISQVQRGNRYNNYKKLVHLINNYLSHVAYKEKVLIVSFNYDLLIEEALESHDTKYTFDNINHYTDFEQRRIILFKPHGSCNWFRRLNLKDFLSQGGDFKNSLQLVSRQLYNNRINLGRLLDNMSDEIEIIKEVANTGAYFKHFPQLLIPYKNKDDFAMPNFQTSILTELLRKVEDVLVIGWKGSEEKFKKLIKDNLGGANLNIYYANAGDDTFVNDYRQLLLNANFKKINELYPSKEERLMSGRPDFSHLIRYLTEKDNFFFK